MKIIENMKLEEAMQMLEQVCQKMETDSTTMEESVVLYEQGMKLSAHCKKLIEGYKGRVTALCNGEEIPFEV